MLNENNRNMGAAASATAKSSFIHLKKVFQTIYLFCMKLNRNYSVAKSMWTYISTYFHVFSCFILLFFAHLRWKSLCKNNNERTVNSCKITEHRLLVKHQPQNTLPLFFLFLFISLISSNRFISLHVIKLSPSPL